MRPDLTKGCLARILGCGILLGLACAFPNSARTSAVVDQCDRLAANPLDPDKPSSIAGTEFERLEANADAAVQACKAAAKDSPQNARMLYQLARAFDASKRVKEAKEWYEKAANLGYRAAMRNLGISYENASRPQFAETWYLKAAALGDVYSMLSLGEMAEKGADFPKAKAWYRKAAGHQLSAARERLREFDAPRATTEKAFLSLLSRWFASREDILDDDGCRWHLDESYLSLEQNLEVFSSLSRRRVDCLDKRPRQHFEMATASLKNLEASIANYQGIDGQNSKLWKNLAGTKLRALGFFCRSGKKCVIRMSAGDSRPSKADLYGQSSSQDDAIVFLAPQSQQELEQGIKRFEQLQRSALGGSQ